LLQAVLIPPLVVPPVVAPAVPPVELPPPVDPPPLEVTVEVVVVSPPPLLQASCKSKLLPITKSL
jgi:hypothetical protein